MNSILNHAKKSIKPFAFITALHAHRNHTRAQKLARVQRSASQPPPSCILRRGWGTGRGESLRFAVRLGLLIVLISAGMRAFAVGPLDIWQNRTLLTNTNYLCSVVYGNGRFVTVGYGGTVLYSLDGTTWNAAPKVTTKDLYTVTYGNGLFVAGGSGRTILTSTNGVAWLVYPSASSAALFCGTYGNGKYLFAGTSQIVESTAGGTWFPHTQPFPEVLDGLTFGNGKFVGVGSDYATDVPVIYTSTDGTGWTLRNPQVFESLLGAAYGNGLFVATGSYGAVTTSPDGNTWTDRSIATTNTLWDVDYGNNTFIAVGWAGAIFSSTNGVNWTLRPSGTPNAFYGVAFGNNTFVAVGRYGTIVQSAPLPSGSGTDAVTLSQPVRTGNSFTFQFNGSIGQTYQVQASTNLINWTTLTNILCTNSPASCGLGGQTGPKRFYRVVKP
jgi:hypothetical protein